MSPIAATRAICSWFFRSIEGFLFDVSGVATVVSVSAADEMYKPLYSNPL